MTRRSSSPAKPHAKKKAARREMSPDHLWAARITRRILLDCHPWQRDGVIDPARRISLCVGRGGAKTTTERARAIIKLIWLRNQRIGFAATSADQARELNWDYIPSLCEAYGIRTTGADPDVTLLDTKMRMICHRTGSIYRLRGVEDRADAEKFRGFPQAEFQADECGSFPPQLLAYLINQCVAPRLGQALALAPGLLEFLIEWDEKEPIPEELIPNDAHRGGCVILSSTPPAQKRGLFYEVTREGSKRHRPYARRKEPAYKGWLGFSSHFWTLEDVVGLPKARERYPALVYNWEEALREKEEQGWSDENPIWKREYRGIWADDDTDTVFRYRPHVDGVEWNRWNPLAWDETSAAPRLTTFDETKTIVAKLREQFGDVRFVIAADEGHKDPFALNAWAFSPRDPKRFKWHVFAFERTEMYARLVADMLLGAKEVADFLATGKFPTTYGGLFGAIGGWPDGLVLDGDDFTIAELKNQYGIQFVKADRKPDSKVGGVELCNGDLVDGRIKILAGTPLERQIVVLQWKDDDFGQRKEDKAQANHSTDTMIYGRKLIEDLYISGAVVQDAKTESPETYKDPMGLDPGIVPDEGDEEEGLLAPSEWEEDEDDWG